VIKNRAIATWLFAVSFLVVVMVVYGGWVRLTRAGLSIVEWAPVTGVIPPTSLRAWDQAFEAYRQTEEYRQVHQSLTLEQFRFLYYMEYGHRLLGRLTGLAFLVPLVVFVARGDILRPRLRAFVAVALLFALQGVLGWLMVKTGLAGLPHVSHLSLTLHLGAALLLLAACLWLGFGYAIGQPRPEQPRVPGAIRRLSLVALVVTSLQLLAGGLVAGLRAGYLSDTFPKMMGQWIPDGLGRLSPLVANLLDNPAAVHFQHRWFAFVVLAVAAVLNRRARLELLPPYLRGGAKALLHLTSLQILVGVGLIAMHVPRWMASLHQTIGIAILAAALFTCHRAFRS
jgi:cytochrome c oxidase assembly protein subunit 15